MRSVALRYAENFAPECGTIAAHQKVLSDLGFVWYGKLGSPVSSKVTSELLAEDDPRILLIHSGGTERWWAYISSIQREVPPSTEIPAYYRNQAEKFGCWFKIIKFERAEPHVMSRCNVVSSGKVLTEASRQSVSPYFIIDYNPEG
ncbi:MAG: hypothetical protein ACOX1O_00175 [Eggerthellaceae bacterium]